MRINLKALFAFGIAILTATAIFLSIVYLRTSSLPDTHADHHWFYLFQLCQLDWYRAHFFGVTAWAALVVVIAVRSNPDHGLVSACWGIAALIAPWAVLVRGFGLSDVLTQFVPGYTAVWCYLAGNTAALIFFRSRYAASIGSSFAAWIPGLVFPLGLWGYFRVRQGANWPATLPICLVPLFVFSFAPLFLETVSADAERFLKIERRFSSTNLDTWGYQIEIDPGDGSLIVADGNKSIYKYNPFTRTKERRFVADDLAINIQGFGFDSKSGEIAVADAIGGNILFIRSEDLAPVRRQFIEERIAVSPSESISSGRTLLNQSKGVLIAYDFLSYAVQISPEGDRVLWSARNDQLHRVSDGVIDAGAGLVHLVHWGNGLTALDSTRRTVVKRKRFEEKPERIVFDEAGNTLFVTIPARAQILAIDATTYETKKVITTMPGARALALDRVSRRLFIGGFAPFLEIRSLDDFTLIDRLPFSPWGRWLAYNERRHLLYMTSVFDGICEISVPPDKPRGIAATFRRIDPFFPLVRLILPFINTDR